MLLVRSSRFRFGRGRLQPCRGWSGAGEEAVAGERERRLSISEDREGAARITDAQFFAATIGCHRRRARPESGSISTSSICNEPGEPAGKPLHHAGALNMIVCAVAARVMKGSNG